MHMLLAIPFCVVFGFLLAFAIAWVRQVGLPDPAEAVLVGTKPVDAVAAGT
jgi:hypothetical protein